MLGEIELTNIKNDSLLCYYRTFGNEMLLVIHNLTSKSIELAEKEILDERNILVYPNNLQRHETKSITKIQPYSSLIFKHRLH